MKIALYHGYSLGGSGSNEYTRYLARALASLSHEVVLICRDFAPEGHDLVSRAVAYTTDGRPTELFRRENGLAAPVSLHQLPPTSVYPVFLTDRQREGRVKAFPDLTEAELEDYHRAMVAVVTRALADERPDVLHANHLVYQPVVAAEACRATGTPFYVMPHGSAIEYTVKADERFRRAARDGLLAASGVAWIAREVRDRVLGLFPDIRSEIEAKGRMVGVGTDTTLFAPVAPDERAASLARLVELHRPGGKSPAQREELLRALADGDHEAAHRYRDAYDHGLEDDDLPAILDGVPPDGELLLFVGAMTFGKGIQSLVAAMPGIIARRPGAHLLLVGSGGFREALEGLVFALASGDEGLFDALAARGRALEDPRATGPLEDLLCHGARPEARREMFEHGARLGSHVHFLGRLDHLRLRHVFPCCRLAALPSVIKEASPLVFAEALACGVLPIASYHSGLRDGLDDLRPHLPDEIWERMKLPTAPDRRVQGIVDHVCFLLDALKREDLAPRLRRIAEERYDWKPVAQGLVEAARSWCGGG
ncbi:MAG: glycosyltransferase family 4 protein [Planctomycetota bacterium]